jgi:pyrroloquinoline quinone biosynthesis protein B
MHISVLGSAAGGGFPQWNCACRNCRSLRNGSFRGKARTQLQVAISPDGHTWFLLNASPDIRSQIEANSSLHPREGMRHTPISGIVLTSADLDQVLGLLQLREFQPLLIHATASIRRILREDNSVFAALNRVPDQAKWIDIIPGQVFPLTTAPAAHSRLQCHPIPLAAHYPTYVAHARASELAASEALLGLMIEESGRCLAYFPAVPNLETQLWSTLADADVILFDGTFWTDDELIQVRGGGPTARDIGHIPVSGPGGSLNKLASLTKPRKIYVHVNNTNPMLDESGPEYRQVQEAGWEIAEDGWQFKL